MSGGYWVDSAVAWGSGRGDWQPTDLQVPAGTPGASLAAMSAGVVPRVANAAGVQGLAPGPGPVAAAPAVMASTETAGAAWTAAAGPASAHCLPTTDTVDVPLGVRQCAALPMAGPVAGAVGADVVLVVPGVELSAAVAVTTLGGFLAPRICQGQTRVAGRTGTGEAAPTARQAGAVTATATPVVCVTLLSQVGTVAEGTDAYPCWDFLAPRAAGWGFDAPATRALSHASGRARSTVLALPTVRALSRPAPITTLIRFDAALAFDQR